MRLTAGALAALGVVVAAVPSAASAKTTCSAGEKSAVIGGKQTCLKAGEPCTESDYKQYAKYSYICEEANGKYRLKRENSTPCPTGKVCYGVLRPERSSLRRPAFSSASQQAHVRRAFLLT